MTPPAVSWKTRAALAGLFVIVGACGYLRLNDCDLFNPDSPRYVLYSRSIVEGRGYRMIDTPGEPFYSWRPPGLSLLLTPAAWLYPDSTVAAKVIVLASLLALLAILFAYVRRQSGDGWGLLTVALVGLNPYSLFYGTEVLTEVPYTAFALGVLWLLQSTGAPPSRARLFAAAVLLACLPLLRTIGIALIVAVGLWSLTSRARWRCLPVSIAGVLSLAAWTIRNAQVGGATYTGSVTGELARSGVAGLIAKCAETGLFYLKSLLGLLLPGFIGKPAYATTSIGSTPELEVFRIPALIIAGCVFAIALYRMVQRRSDGGGLVLTYLFLYAGCLTVWPWRDERFVWPLVPLVWAFFVKRGTSVATTTSSAMAGPDAIQFTPARHRFRAAFACTLCVALVAWQLTDCRRMVASNMEFRRDGDQFYATAIPSFYYCDWHAAGRWIREHTPDASRLLTWHAAVGVTAHRYQQRVIFETQTPRQLHQRIREFSARYLVIPTAQFGDGFAWHLLTGDPVFRYTPVYEARNVMVLEVTPNREGTIHFSDNALAERISACKQAYARQPARIDLQVRLGSLLNEAGQRDDALRMLQSAARHGGNARLFAELGQLLMQTGKYTEAARNFEAAAGMPYAEPIADSLRQSAAKSRELASRKPGEASPTEQAAQFLDSAKRSLEMLRYDVAEKQIDRALTLVPDSAEGLFLRGAIRQRRGMLDGAEQDFEAALRAGHAAAKRKLLLLRTARAIEQPGPVTVQVGAEAHVVDSRQVTAFLRLAEMYREDGIPGKGLAVLELASRKLGDSPELLQALANSYQEFALSETALPLYEQVLSKKPADAEALRGLNECQVVLQRGSNQRPGT